MFFCGASNREYQGNELMKAIRLISEYFHEACRGFKYC